MYRQKCDWFRELLYAINTLIYLTWNSLRHIHGLAGLLLWSFKVADLLFRWRAWKLPWMWSGISRCALCAAWKHCVGEGFRRLKVVTGDTINCAVVVRNSCYKKKEIYIIYPTNCIRFVYQLLVLSYTMYIIRRTCISYRPGPILNKLSVFIILSYI